MSIFGQRKTAKGIRVNGTLPRGKPNRHRLAKLRDFSLFPIEPTGEMSHHREWNDAVRAKKIERHIRRRTRDRIARESA